MIGENCETGLFSTKFPLLDHLCMDFERVASAGFQDAFRHEHSSAVLKKAYRRKSTMRGSGFENPVH